MDAVAGLKAACIDLTGSQSSQDAERGPPRQAQPPTAVLQPKQEPGQPQQVPGTAAQGAQQPVGLLLPAAARGEASGHAPAPEPSAGAEPASTSARGSAKREPDFSGQSRRPKRQRGTVDYNGDHVEAAIAAEELRAAKRRARAVRPAHASGMQRQAAQPAPVGEGRPATQMASLIILAPPGARACGGVQEQDDRTEDEVAAETAAYVGLNSQGLSPEEEGLLPLGAHEALYVTVHPFPSSLYHPQNCLSDPAHARRASGMRCQSAASRRGRLVRTSRSI